MKIIIGSLNQAKINAVKNVFKNYVVEAINSSSNISDQPMTDDETLLGAINRAKNCHKNYPTDLAIGLEGGVMLIKEELYLCNWGVLMPPNKKMIKASGARINLPLEFLSDLNAGIELSELVDNYSKKSNTRSFEGAIGIFTDDEINREQMFEHVLHLLKGQYQHVLKQK